MPKMTLKTAGLRPFSTANPIRMLARGFAQPASVLAGMCPICIGLDCGFGEFCGESAIMADAQGLRAFVHEHYRSSSNYSSPVGTTAARRGTPLARGIALGLSRRAGPDQAVSGRARAVGLRGFRG